MNQSLEKKCDLFLENNKIIFQLYKWNNKTMNSAAAYLFTASDLVVDAALFRTAEDILKRNTTAFSTFRQTIKLPLLSKMILSGHAESYLNSVQKIYNLQKERKYLFSTEFNVLSAMVMVEHLDGRDPQDLVEQTQAYYHLMKKRHPWLTDDEDMVYAAILAASQVNIDAFAAETEANYRILKEKFHNAKAVKSLSYVLAVNKQAAESKITKVINIYEGLKNKGHRYSSDYQLAALGTLSFLEVNEDILISKIIEVDDYLKAHKGLGKFSLGSAMRPVFASQLVLQYHASEVVQATELVLGSSLAFTIAMEIASMLAISTMIRSATLSSINMNK